MIEGHGPSFNSGGRGADTTVVTGMTVTAAVVAIDEIARRRLVSAGSDHHERLVDGFLVDNAGVATPA
jgi:hypothetical protein